MVATAEKVSTAAKVLMAAMGAAAEGRGTV
jgi:hypothetical protein